MLRGKHNRARGQGTMSVAIATEIKEEAIHTLAEIGRTLILSATMQVAVMIVASEGENNLLN